MKVIFFFLLILVSGCVSESVPELTEEINLENFTEIAEETPKIVQEKKGLLNPYPCEGKGSFRLNVSPLALDNILKIVPMGQVSSFHITPTDHQYWHTIDYFGSEDDTNNLDRFNVYAPAGGRIVEIEKSKDYRLLIEHTCDFYTIFIHVDKLSDKIKSYVNFEEDTSYEHEWPQIPVEEGEIVGTIGVGKLDFSVVDGSVMLKGFVNPETYEGEPWKIHTVDTFDYYEEPLRSELLAKNLRKIEPFGGKIDYDVEGKLIGNWFVENTNGYKGLGNENYWSTHLSIVYDALDPEHVIVSIGDFDGMGKQFGVKGNLPDPKDVSAENGIVKYELAPYSYYSKGKLWNEIDYVEDIKAENTDEVRGVALFQLMEGGKLKAEFFPNKKENEVSGFTEKAKLYER